MSKIPPPSTEDETNGLDELFRDHWRKLVGALTRRFSPAYLDLIENCVQDAMIKAAETWPTNGRPDNPAAWLRRVAHNLVIDALRRDTSFEGKSDAIRAHYYAGADDTLDSAELGGPLDDDVLKMMLICCHVDLSERAQISLILRNICGFGIGEIARALHMGETAVTKTLTRARQTIRENGLQFAVPDGESLGLRLEAVNAAVYLLFNEGYLAHRGDRLVRAELCREAVRVVELILASRPEEPGKIHALAALMYLQASRLSARTDADGNLLTIAEQDRSHWDRRLIRIGIGHLDASLHSVDRSPYHFQAAIAACHALAPTFEDTDWHRILELYDYLLTVDPSPTVALNRSVAVMMIDGPEAAIALLTVLEKDGALRDDHLLPALLADFNRRAGNEHTAEVHYQRALELAQSVPEKRFLRRRIAECSHDYAPERIDIRS